MDYKILKDKVLACWMGKNIGGTFGMPFEWYRQINDATFYVQKQSGPAPNDDLDIQLIYLIAMEDFGLDVDSHILAYYWNLFLTPHWAEYGNAKANMKLGIRPPYSGTVNNIYEHSNGSFIRSEIWACICAGNPDAAVKYMVQDSSIDHGVRAEGTYAAAFMAALGSLAFVEKNYRRLIEKSLSYLPSECGVARAIAYVMKCYDEKLDFKDCRHGILEQFRGAPFVEQRKGKKIVQISEADRKNNFDTGAKGYDAPSNIAIIVLGLLYSGGDFDRLMYLTNACGEDTDCTAASVGAIFGIMNGSEAFPKKWLEPIGSDIKTCSINYGEMEGMPGRIPKDVYELTDRVLVLMEKGALCRQDLPEDIASDAFLQRVFFDGELMTFPFYDIFISYPDGLFYKPHERIRLRVKIVNKTRASENLVVRLLSLGGTEMATGAIRNVYLARDIYGTNSAEIEFEPIFEKTEASSDLVIHVSVVGKSEFMTVPIRFFCA